MRVLGSVRGPLEKHREPSTLGRGTGVPKDAVPPYIGCETGDYWKAEISLVIGINQTNHSTNQERPCTTVQRIKKERSICQSQLRPDPVSFPVLSN